jgi:histone acetyltransferase (RNA polymerase elongator complex component)
MKPFIIPIFIMNRGCPNRCVFCNERITGGDYEEINEDLFNRTVEEYLKSRRNTQSQEVQIAFYGGNFTGMEAWLQDKLLAYALPFIKKGIVASIRISTRPDWINERSLAFLKKRYVKTIEIGAQSLNDEVLLLSGRGHTSEQVKKAIYSLKVSGFEAGIHLMAGLPGDTKVSFMKSISETVELRPDMVRIHPTVVLKKTKLAELYEQGLYQPMSMDEAVDWCKDALLLFKLAHIPVIRIGLHTTPEMVLEKGIVSGPFHPAFRTLVENAIFLDMALGLLQMVSPSSKRICFYISPKDSSNFRGIKNSTVTVLKTKQRKTMFSIK